MQGGGPAQPEAGLHPQADRPERGAGSRPRAHYIEWVAERLDAGEEDLATEGAVAKYLATEAGNKAAEDAIQALGGYGYTREYMVEKIKRDVRITTIYEGTSEIMEWTIARDRWQLHLKSRGQYYLDWAARAEARHAQSPNVGAGVAALALRVARPRSSSGPPRPPDPQPARPLPPRRADRVRRDGGPLRRARRAAAHEGERPRAGDARGDGPRPRPRGGAQGGEPRACAGRSAPARPTPPSPRLLNLEAAVAAQAGLVEDMDRIAADLNRAFPAK